MIEEVILTVDRPNARADLTIRWRSCAVTTTSVALPRRTPPKIRTDDDTLDLLRRLATRTMSSPASSIAKAGPPPATSALPLR